MSMSCHCMRAPGTSRPSERRVRRYGFSAAVVGSADGHKHLQQPRNHTVQRVRFEGDSCSDCSERPYGYKRPDKPVCNTASDKNGITTTTKNRGLTLDLQTTPFVGNAHKDMTSSVIYLEQFFADCKKRAAEQSASHNPSANQPQARTARVAPKSRRDRSSSHQWRTRHESVTRPLADTPHFSTSSVQLANYHATPRRRQSNQSSARLNANRASLNLQLAGQKLSNLFRGLSTEKMTSIGTSPSVPNELNQSMGQTIKRRFKSALKSRSQRPKSTGSHSDLSENGSPSPVKLRQNLDPFGTARHELELAIRYLHEVVRTSKLEMLAGSATAILECVVRMHSTLHMQHHEQHHEFQRQYEFMYKAVLDLIRWADQSLVERAIQSPGTDRQSKTNSTNSADSGTILPSLSLEEAKKRTASLTSAFEQLVSVLKGETQPIIVKTEQDVLNRQSADSGTISSMDEDVRNNNQPSSYGSWLLDHLNYIDQSPMQPEQPLMKPKQTPTTLQVPPIAPPVPPRCTKPAPLKHKQTDSFTSSNNDSGMGADSQYGSNGSSPAAVEDPDAAARLFQETYSEPTTSRLFSTESLNDILKELNINKSTRRPLHIPAETGETSQPVCTTERIEQIGTDGQRLVRTRTVTTHQTVRCSVNETSTTDEVLIQQLHSAPANQMSVEKFAEYRITGERNHDYVTSENTTRAAPPLPPKSYVPGKPSGNKLRTHPGPPVPPRQTVRQTGVQKVNTVQTVSRQAAVNGRVVVSQRENVQNFNKTSYSLNTELDQNGQVAGRAGNAVTQGTTLQKSTVNNAPNASVGTSTQKPPLPRRRQHENITTYMRVFDVLGDSVHCSSANQSTTNMARRDPSTPRPKSTNNGHSDDFRHSALASYVMLRDHLSQYERLSAMGSSPENKRLSISGGAKSIAAQFRHTPLLTTTASTASNDFTNLENLLHFDDDDMLRMPKKYAQQAVDCNKNIDDDLVKVQSPEQPKAVVSQERQTMPATAESVVLTETDVKDYLVLRARDNELGEVRGGPVDALIAHATQPDATLLLYQEAFLTTYRTFVKPVQLLDKLVHRYKHLQQHNGLVEHSQRKVARHTFSLIVRVVDELAPVELSMDVVSTVNSFIYRLIEQGELSLVRILRQRFLERLEEKAGFKRALPLYSSQTLPHAKRTPTIIDMKSREIAEQLTCIDSELFQKIELSEMLHWAQNQCAESSPNLVIFTEHFNKVSYWVRTKVIDQPDQKERERYYWKFIKVMRHLRRLGNFNSFLALLSALDSGPVRRLPWPKPIQEAIAEHAGIMDSSKSFMNYREALATTPPPCIPYVGLILQDLTFIHVGSSNDLLPERCQGRKGLVNFGKRWQQFAILDSVRKFKSWSYDFERNDQVIATFNKFEDYLVEDAIWEMSEKLKPRGGRRV